MRYNAGLQTHSIRLQLPRQRKVKMLIGPNTELTDSIRQYDSQAADHLLFLGYKMEDDLTEHINSRIEPARLKMIDESCKMICDKYNSMVKRARGVITRRYRNPVRNTIDHMNYKRLKAGDRKLEIRKDFDGKWLCSLDRPSSPLSPPPSCHSDSDPDSPRLYIDTDPDRQQHDDSTPLPDSSKPHSPSSDDDADYTVKKKRGRSPPSKAPITKQARTLGQIYRDSNADWTCSPSPPSSALSPPPKAHSPSTDDADLSNKNAPPRSRTPIAVVQPNPKVNIAKEHRTLTPLHQCEQNTTSSSLDFTDNAIRSYAEIHNYLSVCNCQICVKMVFERKNYFQK